MELPDELEAALRDDPDDRASYLVAADWLQEQGDPHGELIALSCEHAALDASIPAKRHLELAWRIAALQRELDPEITGSARVKIAWRWGFISGIEIRSILAREDLVVLRDVLQSPRARLVRDVALTGPAHGKLTGTLVAHAAMLTCARSLVLDSSDLSKPMNLSPLWACTERLERLVLAVPRARGAIVLPRLTELSLADGIDVLDGAELPCLNTLRVELTARDTPSPAWFSRDRFPSLERLSLSSRSAIDLAPWAQAEFPRGLELFDVTLLDRHDSQRSFVIDRTRREVSALLVVVGDVTRPPGALAVLPETGEVDIGRRDIQSAMLQGGNYRYDHAQLTRGADGWSVRESSGVSVNRQSIHRVTLRSGDELAVGQRVFRFLEAGSQAQLLALANQQRARLGLASTALVSPTDLGA